jgi:uncharacterized protein with HEPN domain
MAHADEVYIRHILDAILRIDSYLHGIDEEVFYENYLVQDGVIRQLEIIGEASKQISQKTRSEHNQIPWKDIAGMRDKLVHDYFGVDVEQVWHTAKNDIPILQEDIKEVLNLLS